jgi:hypothetical protein
MRTSKKDVENLFERVCEVYRLTTRKDITTRIENPKQKDFYSKDWYKLDYASCYGGYSFRIVATYTGEDFAFSTGGERYSIREAYTFLRGLLAAKFLIENK